jgi:hypothetical protein
MTQIYKLFAALATLSFCCLSTARSEEAYAAPETIASRLAEVRGVKLHYLVAGHGPAVISLHGYTQTSRMSKPIIPLLAQKFTGIAPGLRRIADSGIPVDGLDMKTAAIRIHALALSHWESKKQEWLATT